MKTKRDKGKTFTFQLEPTVRAVLDRIAAAKEWTTGHLVSSILTEYVASQGKPAKTRKAAKKTAALECQQILEPAPNDDPAPF